MRTISKACSWLFNIFFKS